MTSPSSNGNPELRLLPTGMSFRSGNVADNWRRFKQKIDFCLQAMAATRANDKKKVGILMTALGDEGLDIFNTFTDLDPANCNYDEVIEQFDKYCSPRRNTVFERYEFSRLVQGDKKIDAFIVALINQARKCEFHEMEKDNLIRDRLVVGVNSDEVRKQMLRDTELTLESATALAKIWEKSTAEAAAMSVPSSHVDIHEFRRANRPLPSPRALPSSRDRQPTDRPSCTNCGYDQHAAGVKCPATDRECNYCHKPGHFTSVCRRRSMSKPSVAAVTTSPSCSGADPPSVAPSAAAVDKQQSAQSESLLQSLEILNMHAISSFRHRAAWYTTVQIGRDQFDFKIDTGAECNTVSNDDFNRIRPRPRLLRSSAVLRPYGDGQLIVPLGEALLKVTVNGQQRSVRVFVIDRKNGSTVRIDNILGLPTVEELGLVMKTFAVTPTTASKPPIFNEFSDVFDLLLGNMPGTVSLVTRANVQPVAEKPRRFPFELKPRLTAALLDLEKLSIISRVNEPTEWVSNLIVVTKSNGNLRICLDPKRLNEALVIPKCEIPKCDDIFAELHNKRYFTVFDLKDGFWQLNLDKESSLLTTFNSPIGRFRWNRLVMGISSAPEIFMNKMRELFGDIPGVFPYFDDLIVTGETEDEHDAVLRRLLQRARSVGVKFNADKVQYKQSCVNYLGFQIGEHGVRPLAKHTTAIEEMPRPEDRNGVLRLLGMIRYLARFIPDLSANSEALRKLTRKNFAFQWLDEHETEFQALKEKIRKAADLKFYVQSEPLFIQTDSSKSGVGCCLYQQGAPISYASRALSRTEERYAQIEKELLAVVFALEKFHDYTYGRHVTVFSDHRPLVSIVKKPISELTPRLQRLRLRLLRYNFDLIFQPGREMFVADTLSRAYLREPTVDDADNDFEVHTCSNVVATAVRFAELVAATKGDVDLQSLKVYLRGGWPKSKRRLSPALSKFRTFANDLDFRGELLFFKNRLVIPASLVNSVLESLHEGHLNVAKTLKLAKNSVFWLGMSTDITSFVSACNTCNRFRNNNVKEPLKSFQPPTRPWERLHSDLFTCNSVDFLVMFDAYSGWIEIFTLRAKSILEVIEHFKVVFARFGVPDAIVTDNVPYNSREWLSFAEKWGFGPLFSSPRYPQSNGASEKAVAIAKSIIKKNVDVQYALLQYRNAPIPHLDLSPAQLLMSRQLRTRVPVTTEQLLPKLVDCDVVASKKLLQQATQQYYYDRGSRSLPPLSVGEEVYYKKNLTDSEWRPATVTKIGDGPRSYEVTDAESKGQYLRNRRFIRKPARFRDL